MNTHTKSLIAAGSAAALLLTACGDGGGSGDEEFNASGTVRITVAMAAGGGSDRAARVLSEAINEEAEGYNTVVENREGSGGAVGWSHFHGLAGDANNLVKAETAIHTLPLQEGVDVSWTYADFTPIALFAEDSRMVVAPADSPYDTCDEVIDASQDADVSSGVSGTYGADGMVLHHMEEAGFDANTVPFGSTGEVITGLLGGQIDLAPASAAAVVPYIEAGDFKALCTFSEERYSDDDLLADVETAEEQGIDGVVTLWRGFLAPPEITDAEQEFWIEEIQRAVETEAYSDYIEDDLLIEEHLYGDEFAEYLDEYDAEIQEYFG